MSVLAAIRPDEWNFPLLVHVLGAVRVDRSHVPKQRLAALRPDLFSGTTGLAVLFSGLTVLDKDLRFVRINERMAEINGIAAAGDARGDQA